MRIAILLIFVSLIGYDSYCQNIPLYSVLDSVKAIEKQNLQKLSGHSSRHIIDSVQDSYSDIKDSIRDKAHDCADSIIEHMDRYTHFELGLDMVTNQYYYGRRGPAAGVVGTPEIKYLNRTGLYGLFNADIYRLKYSLVRQTRLGKQDTTSGQKTEPDLLFRAGFFRTFYEKWDFELFYDHTFIFYGTDKNLLSNTVDLNTSFDFWDYITVGVEYQFLFGGASNDSYKKKLSNVLLFDLYKDFRIYRLPNSAILTIGPEIISNVGNDNLARSRVIAKNRHGGENVPELYDNFFGLLDLEGAVNISYRIKNLELSFDPHIALPFNEIPTTLPPTVTTASELAPYRQNQMQKPIFYATVGIRYYFKFWKEKGRHNKALPKQGPKY